MNLYSARIRLGGNLLHEVNKHDMSPGEMILMMREHGDDAVVSVKHTSVVDRKSHEEYERLCGLYGHDKVRKLFGERFAAQMPDEAVGLSVDPEPMAEEPKRRTVTLNKGK